MPTYNPIALSRTQDTIASLSPVFWFDPSRLQGLAASSKITNPVDNTGTYKLRPMSGMLSANIPFTVPSSKNSKCTLKFGGGAHINGYTLPTITLTAFTAFQVIKPIGGSGSIFPCMFGNSSTNSFYINLGDYSTPFKFASALTSGGVLNATAPSTYSLNSWYVIRTVYDGATLTVYQNGSAGTPASGSGRSAIFDQFGIYGTGTFLNSSEFGDSILFNSALSAGNQTLVESALNAKWAIY